MFLAVWRSVKSLEGSVAAGELRSDDKQRAFLRRTHRYESDRSCTLRVRCSCSVALAHRYLLGRGDAHERAPAGEGRRVYLDPWRN